MRRGEWLCSGFTNLKSCLCLFFSQSPSSQSSSISFKSRSCKSRCNMTCSVSLGISVLVVRFCLAVHPTALNVAAASKKTINKFTFFIKTVCRIIYNLFKRLSIFEKSVKLLSF